MFFSLNFNMLFLVIVDTLLHMAVCHCNDPLTTECVIDIFENKKADCVERLSKPASGAVFLIHLAQRFGKGNILLHMETVMKLLHQVNMCQKIRVVRIFY